MALMMDQQTSPGGSYTPVDMAEKRVCQMKLLISFDHPARLEFVCYAPQHTFPFALRTFIRLWDPDAEYDDSAFGQDNPIFEGFVAEVQPVDSNLVQIVAYDPTYQAGHEIMVQSLPWEAGSPPTRPSGSVPRLVLNAYDNDDDYAFCRDFNVTVGGLFSGLLNDALQPLRWYNCAPPDTVAYDAAELDVFVHRPQEKIVYESETLGDAIRRTLTWVPDYKLLWVPGARKWHFFDPAVAPEVTLTLNKFADDDYRVLSLDLKRSNEGRYPATEITGPPTTDIVQYSIGAGTLQYADSGVFLEEYVDFTGTHQVVAHAQFQIVDEDDRPGARLLKETVFAPVGAYQWIATRSPFLEITFDHGATWLAVSNTSFDFFNGTVSTGFPIFFWTDAVLITGSTQNFFVPDDFRLTWAPFREPLRVRYPETGYDGTSNSVAGMATELTLYDESLAVGYERGTPVTTETREEQFTLLAQRYHAYQKDIIYTGGCLLDGIEWNFLRLNRRVNLAGVDGDGTAIPTAWEAIGAIHTDTEYNFDEQTTQLTFSSDQMEVIGIPIDLFKQRIGVRPLVRLEDDWIAGNIRFGANSLIYLVQDIRYVDPVTGRAEAPKRGRNQ